MRSYTDKIREAAKRLLSEKSVDAVIGFRKGTIPFANEPFIAKTPEQADQLYFDGFCGVHLANYLPKRTDKVAIVAKGCDSRSLSVQIVEGQVKREMVYVLGAPCKGMLDRRLLNKEMAGKDVTDVEESGDSLKVSGKDFAVTFERAKVLQENCAICIHRNPVVSDELMGDVVVEQSDVDRYADIRAIDEMSPEEKWKHFEDSVSTCIRCYACRSACPACYCPTCFVDESRPQWVGKTTDSTDIRTFHFLRAFHLAGRCTDCGACERSCPMGIKVRQFTKKLEKDVKDLYGFEAGMTAGERPPLDTHRPGDPESFIK